MSYPRSLTTINFSIDSHYLIVIEADGTLVSPVLLREIKIAPGERYSVILKPFDMIIQKSQEFILRMRVDHT
jgi:FtsP/CotA-like multicopper oxidase with cupredoxin domain